MDTVRLEQGQELRHWLEAVTPRWDWDAAHMRLLQAELQAVTEGRVDRLMLFLPPRHGKSELVTVRYPVYRLEREPGLRVIVGAYNQALAGRFSRRSRRLAQERFALSRERTAAWDWETPSGGGIRAVGVGGGVTGLGADLILIDDPVKSREEAESPVYRDRVWDWYRDDLYTRQEPGCALVLVMTRWHEDDLAGRILNSEEGHRWRVVRLPALAESESEYAAWTERLRGVSSEDEGQNPGGGSNSHFSLLNPQFSIPTDPLGRPEGAPLWPERFNQAALARIRSTLGTRSFAALYQGRPLPPEGGLFQRGWFRVADTLHFAFPNLQFALPPTPSPVRWARFWDTAATAGQRSDYWAGALLGRTPEGEWVLADMVRGRWEYPEAKRQVLRVAAADGPDVPVLVEESASGSALLQDLRQDPSAEGYFLRGVRVAAEKAVRAATWASQAESGRFWVLRAHWNAAFLAEAETFPHAAHDDQVDAVSGAYGYLTEVTRTRRLIAIAGRPR